MQKTVTKKPSRSARVPLTTLYTGQSAPLAFGANNHQAENNANNVNYTDNNIDSKLLYVAMTRAMHELYVNYNGELPTSLKSLSKENKILKRTK